jgi:hypothetical protein
MVAMAETAKVGRKTVLSWQECLRGEHEDVFEALSEIKKELAN